MNNNENKPFKVQKLDDPSVLYPHLTDYVPKEKYIPQKPNIKVNRTQSVIRKVPHMVDQYERQECIERFHDLKNRIQIKIPFKCPKNHIIQTKKPFFQDTNAFAQKILINNLNQLQINEKSIQKKQQYQQLKNKATQIFNRKPKHDKQTNQQFGFDKSIFHDIPNLQKLLSIKISPQRKSCRKTKEQSKRLPKSQKKIENTQLSQSLLNINNPICEQNHLKQNIYTFTSNQSQIQPSLDVSPPNQGFQIKLSDSNINISDSPKEIPSSFTQRVEQLKTITPKAATPKANTSKDNTPQNNILQANSPLKTDTPKANTPKANTPKIIPKANTPGVNTSKANTPKANTPKADIHKVNTPKANTHKASTPKATTPKANTTKAKETTPKNRIQPIFRQNSQFTEERKEGSQQREETKSQSIRKGSHDKNQQFDNCEVVVTVVRNGGRILKTEQNQRPNSAKSKTPTQQVFPLKKTKSQVKTTRNNETIDISLFRKQNNVNQPKIEKQQIKQKNDRPKSANINQLGGQYISNRPKSVQKVKQINKIEISEFKQEIIHKTQKKQKEQGKIQIALVDSSSQQAIPNSISNREESPQKLLESFLNSQVQDSKLQMGESKLQEQLSLTVSQVSEQPMKQSRFIKKQK